ncbi:polysaccharide biosynthesis protein [Acidaminobacter hydrogenoformans]|uniref:NDP-sugar epimerase, includes UDP-GlcNAc-inverting 4,6-dehydratase FlaA1 and capsular polysaccharide biosynthesis protein EpsC n=1 Tax=Acidaminobacter hydrogenoformans DSM 2784 TaxID=1120920 RepID=A0A1G5S4U6_9FIRM|nr:nucleoside-diphosphate sugar epimerase/dehydratase [Acidaminobacter hydrogenoformans]SCZ81385.1 NDP-sugar epimerase, includes UDP-GlcNAc-inverting 4,6-dehydratase FlaA1 and capsular polysaccharide biosynthesis protein EpsC [Acidaminobacter hydrogenoformans DSM 2784]
MRTTRKLSIMLLDIGFLFASMLAAIVLKADFERLFHLFENAPHFILLMIGIKLVFLKLLMLYDSLWEHASVDELIRIAVFGALSHFTVVALDLYMDGEFSYKSLLLISFFDVVLIGGFRMSYRVLRRLMSRASNITQSYKSVLIIGAGHTGGMTARHLLSEPQRLGYPKAFIDDDPLKEGTLVSGIKVLGNRYDILSVVKRQKIDEIILAIPTVPMQDRREILSECKRTGVKVKTVPSLEEMMVDNVDLKKIRDVEIEDLLGRDEVNLDMAGIKDYLEGKTVLVTGGGGSIGSELCRQILRFAPKKLIILDINENAVYDLSNELKARGLAGVDLDTVITSVRDRKELQRAFQTLKPQVVFHAAAHKHVPLMERSPQEAIKNNVFGTMNLVDAALKNDVERFVLISTDKAVNPTSVMGVSKRIAEMIVQSVESNKTIFTAVRFGNVLGSNGSVIPLFKKQIQAGGPVTVTHKDMVRYFMTIPEASRLVLQAGGLAKGGDVFVLDMGEPVRILNLAEDLIRLSGLEPYKDIEIEFTGLRPGEKLFEELLTSEESVESKTKHEKIFVGKPGRVEYAILLKRLVLLKELAEGGDQEALLEMLASLVTSYQRDNREINKAFLENGCTALIKEMKSRKLAMS